MIAAIGAAPFPEPEVEDRRLGRVAGLDPELWATEMRAYRGGWLRTYAWLALAVGAVALGGRAAIRRLRRGRDRRA